MTWKPKRRPYPPANHLARLSHGPEPRICRLRVVAMRPLVRLSPPIAPPPNAPMVNAAVQNRCVVSPSAGVAATIAMKSPLQFGQPTLSVRCRW